MPVSYTHLDVYKRQGIMIVQCMLFTLVVLSTYHPVSYTHLDVYKRQVVRAAVLDVTRGFVHSHSM